MEDEQIQNNADFSFSEDTGSYSNHKIKVIGVGGGGSNAINHMYNMGIRNVSFIVANTDKQALDNSPVPTKVLLGPNVTRGRGAGNVPDNARKAAEESADEIRALFDEDTDMVFITAGMGGGTGTGASPVISRIARERGLLTIGIVTIPFLFEGQRKILKALEGAKEMGKYVDALLVINNERLSEIYSDCNFLNAFGKADDILSMAAMSISEIVTCDGYINLDFNDVDNTLRNGGTAIISTGYGEGENRVTKAIEDALNSPLLRNTDIYASKKLLFNLYFSRTAENEFRIDETRQITDFISNIHSDVDIIWGVAMDDSLGDKVKFTILAAGFDSAVDDGEIVRGGHEERVKDFPPKRDTETKQKEVDEPTPPAVTGADEQLIKDNYGEGAVEGLKRTQNENKYIVLRPGQMDDDDVIRTLTDKPAYNRDRREIKSINETSPTTGVTGRPTTPSSINFDENDLP